MDLSVYGSTGFIGSTFVAAYEDFDDIWIVSRHSRRPDPYKSSDIVYFISTTHNYNVREDATIDVKTNLLILTETLESWRRNNPTGVFNFISSWFVYGKQNQLPVNENSPCNPTGFYSITKRCAEQLLISYAETFGLKYRILRLCNIVGKGDKNVSAKKNALQYLINKMKLHEPIELYDRGDFYRTYMHVYDCVEAIRLVIAQGKINEIYNIGGDSYKFADLITYAHNTIGSWSKISYIDPPEFHKTVQVRDFRMDTTKLIDLGFKSTYNMQKLVDSLI